jgi:hypothetical protein
VGLWQTISSGVLCFYGWMHPTWLCITLMVLGTNVTTPYWKDFIFIFIVLLRYPFFFAWGKYILLLALLTTNSTRVIYLHALGSDYLLATNLLDLSLGLDRGRPIWATFVIGRQIVWRTNCKPCPFFYLFCIKWINPVVFVLWAQTPKLSPYTLAWFWHWNLLVFLFLELDVFVWF